MHVIAKQQGHGLWSLIGLPVVWLALSGDLSAAEAEIDPADVEAGIIGEAMIGEAVSARWGGYRGGLRPSCAFIEGFGLADTPDWNRTWTMVGVLDAAWGKPESAGFFVRLGLLREHFGYTAADFSRMADQCRKSLGGAGDS
jgi:hypothetical protein